MKIKEPQQKIFLFLISFILVFSTVLQGGLLALSPPSLTKAYNPGGYVEEDPIIIQNNAELSNFVLEHGFGGSGTPADPYVITNLFFTEYLSSSYAAIQLKETTAYVVIENCSFSLLTGYAISIVSASNIIIRGNYFDVLATAVLVSNSKNVEITGNHVLRASQSFVVGYSTEVRITGNDITSISGFYEVILVQYSNLTVIDNNHVKYKYVNAGYGLEADYGYIGIKISQSETINITRNKIENLQSGIYIISSNKLVIANNTLSNSTFLFNQYSLTASPEIVFENNTAFGKPVLFLLKESGKTIDASSYSQIVVFQSSDIYLHDADIDTIGAFPMFIQDGTNITLKDSVIGHDKKPYTPIYVLDSDQIVLDNCKVSGYNVGVYVKATTNLEIVNSEIEGTDEAIYLSNVSTFFNVTNNVIRNSSYGINLDGCDDGHVEKNKFYDIASTELWLQATYLDSIKHNYFTGYGILLSYYSVPSKLIASDYQNNTIEGKEILYMQNINSVNIVDQDIASILLVQADSVTISGSTMVKAFAGIEILWSQNVNVTDTVIRNNYYSLITEHSLLVNLENVSIENSVWTGFSAYSMQNLTIKNSRVDNTFYGAIISFSQYCSVENTLFTNINQTGLFMRASSYPNITGNTFTNIYFSDIELYKNTNYFVKDNVMEKGFSFYGTIYSVSFMEFIEFSNNTIDNKPIVVIVSNDTVQTITGVSQAILVNATNKTIQNNQFSDVAYPVYIYSSQDILVKDNSFQNNYEPIHCYGSTSISIQGNEFRNVTRRAIYMKNMDGGVISENTVWDSSYDGLYIYKASNIVVEDNLVHASSRVVFLKQGANVTLTGNAFFDGADGLYVYDTSNLTLVNNNFYNTSVSIYTPYYYPDFFSSLKITNNKVNNYPLIYLFNATNQVVENQNIGQIIIAYSSNITINKVRVASASFLITIISSSNITVKNSEINKSTYYGVYLANASNSVFDNNTFSDSLVAMYLYYSTKINITNNLFDQYNSYAIYISGTTKCWVMHNNFKNETITTITSAIDNGKNNEFLYNRWEGWTSPDANNDGYVDSPYYLDGLDENYDPYPLAEKETPPGTTSTGVISKISEIGGSFLSIVDENPWLYGVIGGIIGLLVIGLLLLYRKKKKKRRTSTRTRRRSR